MILKELLGLVAGDLRAASGNVTAGGLFLRLISDPGFAAVFRWRLSYFFRARGSGGRVCSKLLWLWNVRVAACYLSPLATAGPGVVLPHATGIVVGDGARIGSFVTIYQNVTLGRLSDAVAEYPVIGNEVRIYAGASVLGALYVGDGAVIAAGAVVVRDVGADDVVGGVPAKPLRKT